MPKSNRLINLAISIAIVVAIFFLWNTVFLYPLKLLVVFFHESSHAIATILTGGKVIAFEVVPQAGGHVISSGGNRFITLTSGYLGSLLWGILIFSMAVSSNLDRTVMAILGALLITITALLGSNTFVLLFGIATGITMLLSAKFLSAKINDFLLRIIGLTSMLYVPLDIYSDTIARSHLRSDAYMLAEEFGGATIIWGGIWLFISLLFIFFSLRRLFKSKL
jgi:hypothetical protein